MYSLVRRPCLVKFACTLLESAKNTNFTQTWVASLHYDSAWFASSLTRTSLSTDQKLKPWARKMTNKKPRKYNGMVGGPDVQTEKKKRWLFDCKYQPGLAFGPLLHVRIKEISTLLPFSTRASRRFTRQGGLTRLFS